MVDTHQDAYGHALVDRVEPEPCRCNERLPERGVLREHIALLRRRRGDQTIPNNKTSQSLVEQYS